MGHSVHHQGKQQEAQPPPPAKHILNHLAKTLKLTDDQKTNVKQILDNEQQELEALRKSKVTGDDRLQKLSSIEGKSWSAIRLLLTAEQQKKFDVLIKKMAEQRERQARGDGDDMPPPPPDGPPPGGPPPGGGGPP